MDYIDIGEFPVYYTGDSIIEIKNKVKRNRHIKYNKIKKIIEDVMSKKEDYVIVGSELLKKSRKTYRNPNIKNGCNLYSNITFKNGCVYANINTVKSDNNILYRRYKIGMPLFFELIINKDNNTIDIIPASSNLEKGIKHVTRCIQKEGYPTILLRDDTSDILKLRVDVNVGCMYEEKDKNVGISHLLEHMLFNNLVSHKKFKTETTAAEVFNSFHTYHDGSTSFYTSEYIAHIPVKSLNDIVPVFFDMISKFNISNDEYLSKEKKIVIEESILSKRNKIVRAAITTAIAESDKYNLIEVIGIKEDIEKITLKDLESWWNKWYTNDNMTITITGNLDKYKDNIIDVIYKKFKKRNVCTQDREILRPMIKNNKKEIHITDSDLMSGNSVVVSSIHPLYNNKTISVRNKNIIDTKEWILSIIWSSLYGGSRYSSKLDQIIREKHGLSYRTNSHFMFIKLSLSIYSIIDTSIENKNNVIEKIREIIEDLNSNGITKDEFIRIKKELLTNAEPGNISPTEIISQMYTYHGIVDQLNDHISKMLKEITYKEFNDFVKKKNKLLEDYYIFSISNEDNIVK